MSFAQARPGSQESRQPRQPQAGLDNAWRVGSPAQLRPMTADPGSGAAVLALIALFALFAVECILFEVAEVDAVKLV
jgi:hypothetical protein